jgi:4-amino-4-deoxy-L-arabinose transferase-like glycosyltransferase
MKVHQIVLLALLAPILVLALFFRTCYLGQTGLENDEVANTAVARAIYLTGWPSIKTEFLTLQQPYVFHPPFGYGIMAGWFWLVRNTSFAAARLLNVIASIGALLLIFLFMLRIHRGAALLGTFFIALDGWIVMTNRMNYLENLQLLLIVPAMWAYWRATNRPTTLNYALAGLAVGLVVIFKHIGLYLLLGVLAQWLMVRKHHAGHMCLLGTAAVVIASYEVLMYLTFGTVFYAQQLHQAQRFFGLAKARGMDFGVLQALQIIRERYWIYGTTVATLLVGWPLVTWRYIRAVYGKTPSAEPTLLAWAVGGLAFAAMSRLKSPHYLMLWLIPLYLYLALEAAHRLTGRRLLWVPVLVVAFTATNVFTWHVRFGQAHGDVLRNSAAYITTNLPPDAVVATETCLGLLIDQPYISFDKNTLVERLLRERQATHMAVYTSRTTIVGDLPSAVQQASANCITLAIFRGFKDEVRICKLNY